MKYYIDEFPKLPKMLMSKKLDIFEQVTYFLPYFFFKSMNKINKIVKTNQI